MRNLERTLHDSRGRLAGIAYRMLGCWADADDVLQDAYVRVQAADLRRIESLEAYLVTTVTRLCLDRLKSARIQRESYVGPWLPEPVADANDLCPQSNAELADDLSFALLLTLERLSAEERAAFILHDVFDIPFAQIAKTLGKSEPACRQLASRARKSIKADGPTRRVEPAQHEALLEKFVSAVGTGNPTALEDLLADDVVAYSDGGGVKSAALAPIFGADRVTRFFIGLKQKYEKSDNQLRIELTPINGVQGLLIYIGDDLEQTLSIETDGRQIGAVYMVRNPKKLRAFDVRSN